MAQPLQKNINTRFSDQQYEGIQVYTECIFY